MKKQEFETLYDSFCVYCEYATKAPVEGDEDAVFCKKKKKTVLPDGHCHSFIYDLLKRKPQTPSLPDVELPII